MPDILVQDDAVNSPLFLELYATGNVQEIIFNLTQAFRSQWIKKYPTALVWIANEAAWRGIFAGLSKAERDDLIAFVNSL